MIKKASKFFCILPLLFALLITVLVVPGSAKDQAPINIPKTKEESDNCIESIKRKQAKIKEEIIKIRKLITRSRLSHLNTPDHPDSDMP